MNNQFKFASTTQIFLAMIFLFGGLLDFKRALSYDGLENNFLADNWGMPLAIFLTLIFGLGWWFESSVENLVLSKGRTIAILAMAGIILLFILFEFGSLALSTNSFFEISIQSSGKILMAGFFFHLSNIHPDLIAKLQTHN